MAKKGKKKKKDDARRPSGREKKGKPERPERDLIEEEELDLILEEDPYETPPYMPPPKGEGP